MTNVSSNGTDVALPDYPRQEEAEQRVRVSALCCQRYVAGGAAEARKQLGTEQRICTICNRPNISQLFWFDRIEKRLLSFDRTLCKPDPSRKDRVMSILSQLELWFVAGSQSLYGEDALLSVREHSEAIAQALSRSPEIPIKIVPKSVMTSAEGIARLCADATRDEHCVGIIAWMHTFSPARMWVAGLSVLHKPLAHLHTQYNRTLPWSTIDMNFMNLNQSAHGDREFGFIGARLGLQRKVITGFWQNDDLQKKLATWARAAVAWHDAQSLKIARFGDNMRNVAVTEGDKVEAQARLGYSVEGYGVGDLADRVTAISEPEIDRLIAEYDELYELDSVLRANGKYRPALREAAKIELGLTAFLEDGGFNAFTDTFEDLHGLTQLPGIAVQRLMARGYGFGAEGDWKTLPWSGR